MGQVIEGILGPGVTVLGSELPNHRRILLEQMALAISSGERFLGFMNVEQSRVLFIARGRAEYEAFRSRVNIPPRGLHVTHDWPRVKEGCMRELIKYLEDHSSLRIVFLGDYAGVKRKMPSADGNIIAAQELARENDYRDMKRLRDWSAENSVAVVLGHDLSTRGTLLHTGSLKYRDNELWIRQVRSNWRLEALP